MKEFLEEITRRRYCELMLEQVITLLYEKGLLDKDRIVEIGSIISEQIQEEIRGVFDDPRNK